MKVQWPLVCMLIFCLGCSKSSLSNLDPVTTEPNKALQDIEQDDSFSATKICGRRDNRRLSNIDEVGRIRGRYNAKRQTRSVCTGTLIGRRCLVTAGHCESNGYIEFNVPRSVRGRIVSSSLKNRYKISRVVGEEYLRSRLGRDFAVIQLESNNVTGKYPGDVQGYLSVDFNPPAKGDRIRISGYGKDKRDRVANFAQQSHSDKLLRAGRILRYGVDTMGGASGSAVVNKRSGKVIGVHNGGNCRRRGGNNWGTSLVHNTRFRAAIEECLAVYDRE